MFLFQLATRRDEQHGWRVRLVRGKEEDGGNVGPEYSPRLFRQDARGVELPDRYVVPSQQGQRTLPDQLQVSFILTLTFCSIFKVQFIKANESRNIIYHPTYFKYFKSIRVILRP